MPFLFTNSSSQSQSLAPDSVTVNYLIQGGGGGGQLTYGPKTPIPGQNGEVKTGSYVVAKDKVLICEVGGGGRGATNSFKEYAGAVAGTSSILSVCDKAIFSAVGSDPSGQFTTYTTQTPHGLSVNDPIYFPTRDNSTPLFACVVTQIISSTVFKVLGVYRGNIGLPNFNPPTGNTTIYAKKLATKTLVASAAGGADSEFPYPDRPGFVSSITELSVTYANSGPVFNDVYGNDYGSSNSGGRGVIILSMPFFAYVANFSYPSLKFMEDGIIPYRSLSTDNLILTCPVNADVKF